MGEILKLGWCQTDLTSDELVMIAGQFYARVSEGVDDPITATAWVIESGDTRTAMVSCDVVTISDDLRDQVRERVRELVPELEPEAVVLNATHTHSGPDTRIARPGAANVSTPLPFELPVMPVERYVAWASERIAEAIKTAWAKREPSRLGWGLTHAVVGHNRRWTRRDGTSKMYGKTDDPAFSHIEGYEDHAVNVIAAWTTSGELRGLVINLACPSQTSEQIFSLSADFWYDVRVALRRELGSGLPIVPQCSSAGDQSPHHIIRKAAEERMQELRGLNRRQEIARRLAGAVVEVLPWLKKAAESAPIVNARHEVVPVPRRMLTPAEVEQAQADAAEDMATYEALKAELDAHPEQRQEPRWYCAISKAYRHAQWNLAVAKRYELQQQQPELPVEVHALRLGDMAIITNPFEYYLDFGMHIKARSPATQTFLVQLAGSGSYVAPERSLAGGSYGAVPASTVVGPPGGWKLAHESVRLLEDLWP